MRRLARGVGSLGTRCYSEAFATVNYGPPIEPRRPMKDTSKKTRKYDDISLEAFDVKTKKNYNYSETSSVFSHDFIDNSLSGESLYDLIRSGVLYKVSSIDIVLQYHQQIMRMSQKLLGKNLFEYFVRKLIYEQFTGGEDEKAVSQLLTQLEKKNIGGIVDYAVENDISSHRISLPRFLFDQHASTITFVDSGETVPFCHETMDGFCVNIDEFKDTISHFIKSVDIAAQPGSKKGIIAIKVTSLCNPHYLKEINSYIRNVHNTFDNFVGDDDTMNFEMFTRALKSLIKTNEKMRDDSIIEKCFVAAKGDSNRDSVTFQQWEDFLSPKKDLAPFLGCELKDSVLVPSDHLRHEFNLVRARLSFICRYAEEKGVRVLLDAEQSYYQSAIHHMSMELLQRFNTERCVVYNTYQAYLKKNLRRYMDDLDTATSSGRSKKPFLLGAKLVRGAYMEVERQLAHQLETECPVNDTYDATNLSYMRCLVALMDSVKDNTGAGVVATHNPDSVKLATELMASKRVEKSDSKVVFSQLQGMCGYMTNILADQKYNIYKYLPYGPIETVFPYLLRRINENKSVLHRVNYELFLIKKELKKRAKSITSSSKR